MIDARKNYFTNLSNEEKLQLKFNIEKNKGAFGILI